MTQADESTIRLRCPQCFERLKAPAALAGTRRRCPRCQFVFRVPEKSRDDGPREMYKIDDRASSAVSDRPSYILVICPTCNTRIYGTQDQLGQPINCPDCDTQTFVLPPKPSDSESRKTASSDVVDEYALADDEVRRPEVEVEHAPGEVVAAEQTLFPVHCRTCNTMMKFSEAQVGEQAVCPDCRVPLTVPPAPEKQVERDLDLWSAELAADESAGRVGQYRIREKDQRDEEQEQYVLAVCPVCDTRLHPTRDQVGQQIVCPDCDKRFTVPSPRQPERKYDPREQSGQPYEVSQPNQGSTAELVFASRRRRDLAQQKWRNRRSTRFSHAPPRWTFFSGVYTFPFYSNSLAKWIVLSVFSAIVLFLVGVALEAGSHRNIASLASAIFLLGVVGTVGMVCLAAICGAMLAIFTDTAYGYDQVENWPDAVFIDWVTDAFFLINSVCLSAIPVGCLAWVLGSREILLGPLLPASLIVLAPIVLLSMLETGLSLNPFSVIVWQSLFKVWRAWGLFYVETAIIAAAVGSLAALGGLEMAPLLAPLLIAALMIYFRLLGRLAWCCGQYSQQEQDDQTGEEESS